MLSIFATGTRSLALTTLLVCGIGSLAAQPPVQVRNGYFDTGIALWQVASGEIAIWSVEDAFGDPLSGSAQVAIADVDPVNPYRVLQQCVPVNPRGQAHRVQALARMVDDPLSRSSARIVLLAYASTNCSGAYSAHYTSNGVSETIWKRLQVKIPADPGTGSFSINLGIHADDGMGYPSIAKFDRIQLTADILFASDFDP